MARVSVIKCDVCGETFDGQEWATIKIKLNTRSKLDKYDVCGRCLFQHMPNVIAETSDMAETHPHLRN